MSGIGTTMQADHRACDAHFAGFEDAVGREDWDAAVRAFTEFRSATERHFRMEEEILFPELEAVTGVVDGPTAIMRLEHAQTRALLEDVGAAFAARDRRRILALSESLLVLLQQHNMKEEQILYPLADRSLGDPAATVTRMQAVPLDAS